MGQMHSLSRVFEMVLPPVVGTLLLETLKMDRNCIVCVAFWKWCSHQWWERYFRNKREMARHADDAPALCPATFCTNNKKLTSELEDPQISELLIFHWKYVYVGAMSSKIQFSKVNCWSIHCSSIVLYCVSTEAPESRSVGVYCVWEHHLWPTWGLQSPIEAK